MDNSVVPDSSVFIIFGAGGDLTWRKLIPALFDLHVEGFLPEHFAVVGLDRKPYPDDGFLAHLKDGVGQFSRHKAQLEAHWPVFATTLHYLQAEFNEDSSYQTLDAFLKQKDAAWQTTANHNFYLATPPFLMEMIASHLNSAGLLNDHARSRIVVEKPFGHDLASAIELNKQLLSICPEPQIYRIDHYLGKETVQNILAFRFANALFEPIWDRRYIDHVQITVAETVGVGHRGGYYDEAGALRDMVQNHLMQVLSLIAMEPPVTFGADEIRSRKVDVLRAVRPIKKEDVPHVAARGQYDEGWVSGQHVKGYCHESDVAENSSTETFAALKLYIDNWRWRGVPFYLRSGKRLTERVSEAIIRFKPVPHRAFPESVGAHFQANDIVLYIQPNEGITVKLQAKKPGLTMQLGTVNMEFSYEEAFKKPSPEAYETLLLDVMRGDATLFMRSDQVEEAWKIVMPVLDYWAETDDVPGYDAGSWGPDSATELIAQDGRSWVRPQKIASPMPNTQETTT